MLAGISRPDFPYSRIKQEGSDADEEESRRPKSSSPSCERWKAIAIVLGILFTVSFCANTVLVYQRFVKPWRLYNQLPTKFVSLSRNVSKVLAEGTEYTDPNRTVQDAAWDRTNVESYRLYVALDDDYTTSLGLPHSQRWPWDDSKGVYILQAAHEIHCVHVIRSVLVDYHDDVPEAERVWWFSHAVHCLDILRESIMCNANDQPLYTGRLHANVNATKLFAGNGMTRQCRDWDALMAWGDRHSACYAVERPRNPDLNDIERYKSCPDGSRPWEKGVGS